MVMLVLAGGCEVNRLAQHDLDAAVRRYSRSPARDAERYVAGLPPAKQRSPATQPHSAPATQPAAPRTLRQYIRIALSENPQIRAAR